MKKYTLYIICLLLAVATISCKKEKEEDSFLKGQMTDFHGQKAYIDGSNYSCFRQGETIFVNGRNNCTVSALSNSDRTCTISGAEEASGYYAFYPANMISATDISSGFSGATVTLPRVQQYVEESGHQVIDNPMAGYLEGSSGIIQFNNLCALLKVTVKSNWILDSIQVKLNGAELWGTGTVDGANWKLDMNNGTHDTKYETVSLVFPNGMNLSSSLPNGKTFYIVVPQTTIFTDANKNDVIVQIYGRYKTATVSKSYSKELTANQSVAYNTINTLPTITRMEVGVGVFTVEAATNGNPARKVAFAPCNLVQSKSNNNQWLFTESDPYNVSTSVYNYYFTYNNSMNGNNASSDWGWVNIVADLPAHTWRIPTRAEWICILTGSRGTQKNWWFCKVNGQRGAIIYPDNCTLNSPSDNNADINISTWKNTYESAGCIFLPAHHSKGYFNTSTQTYGEEPSKKNNGGGETGYYAMADAYTTGGSSTGWKCFRFLIPGGNNGNGLNCDAKQPSCGVNVRLVHDLN